MRRGLADRLVEREAEVAQLADAIESARMGAGRSLLIVGPAGIGKTALLNVARAGAQRAGCMTAIARGGELEAEYPYCIVRQLLEPPLRAVSEARRARMLDGIAALAAPAVLGPVVEPVALNDRTLSVIRGLSRLIANLASETSIALLIDDVHWADPPSLRFLVHLARQLAGLPVTLIATLRTGEGVTDGDLVDRLRRAPRTRLAVPAALSAAGVSRLLASDLGAAPDVEFTRTCVSLTGGNPFLVRELAAALRSDGVEPTREASAHLAAAAPQTVARSTLTRLGRMSEHAVRFAQTAAVLGADATVGRVAALAELNEDEADTAWQALVAADVMAPGAPLAFRHPIVRSAIYRELAPGACSTAHRKAAAELAGDGATLDAIAGHLLRARPVGSAETIARLRKAAEHALAIGAPESAVSYLVRALEEGPERTLRTELLLQLGLAEQLTGHRTAGARFEEAQRLATDYRTRATAMIERARLDIYRPSPHEALALLDSAIAELTDGDQLLRLRAETVRAALTAYDPRLVTSFEQRLPIIRELAISGGEGSRPLALLLAAWDASHDEPPEPVLELVDRGWDDGRYLETGESLELLPHAVELLVGFEQLDRAEAIVEGIATAAHHSGAVTFGLIASGQRALLETCRGNLAAAEAQLVLSVERALELGLDTLAVLFLWYGADVLLERPAASQLAALLETLVPEQLPETNGSMLLVEARGRLRYFNGMREQGICDLRAVGEAYTALGITGMRGATWRSTLAGMLGSGQAEEARVLIYTELERARRSGQPRRVGVALRALGTLDQDATRLEEAVRALSSSPAALEHARALIELGAVLRRRGERTAAGEPLRRGLELATRCGAVRLVERGQIELDATRARSRRDAANGYDELTPSELRIARMAADGQTSADIARELFVTTRTVNSHLNHAYKKLAISSRKQLADALAARV